MINIGIIASKDEILPSKRKRAANPSRDVDSDNDDNEFRENVDTDANAVKSVSKKSKKPSTRKPTPSNKSLNITELRLQIAVLEDHLKAVLEWLEQSLNDAAEDLDDEEPSDDPDDCVPLVPFSAEQRVAVESPEFQAILKGLGFQQPASEVETYWRIPQELTAADVRLRARIVAGDVEDDDNLVETETQFASVSDAESEDYDFDKAKMKRVTTSVYTQSDDDEESRPAISKKVLAKKTGGKRKRKFDIFDMVKDNEGDIDSEEKENEGQITDSINPPSQVEGDSDSDNEQINKTTKRSKRAIIDSDEDDIDDNPIAAVNPGDSSGEIMDSLVMEEDSPKKTAVKRIRSLGSEELDTEATPGDEDDDIVPIHQVKRKRAAVISDDDDD